MHVAQLHLVDFRNYSRAELSLSPGTTLFIGSNGQGKTNLVEAVVYAGSASSHRVSSDHALIRAGAEAAVIRMQVRHADRAIVIELELNTSRSNRAQANGSPVRMRDLPRYFASVVFAPEDLALIRSDPSVRRSFLDGLIIQRTPRLAGVVADYERVLRQRNSLLKSARASRLRADQLTTLDVWDERLIELGTEIIGARSAVVSALRPYVAKAYSDIAGEHQRVDMALKLSINSLDDDDLPGDNGVAPDDLVQKFRDRLRDVRRDELDRAVTLIGPHRDDLVLSLNQLPARGYASHGESWSYALALKLASAEVLRQDAIAGDPVLILDDVFAELDHARRERLADAIVGFEQVLITAAVDADVPERLAARRIRIQAGSIHQEPT